jgi:pyruvate dehydrogenase E1 component beta subunit
MKADPRVVAIGIGVNSPWYVGNTMQGLAKKFGHDRVIDPPVSENGFTGMAVGAALSGLRPIVIHPRMDFMYYAFDQLVNHASAWKMMFGPDVKMPLVIRGIVNRGGQQGCQHSQSLHSVFMHIPGFKVVMPSTPADAKGLLLSAIADDGPVLYIDDRWNYEQKADVPEKPFKVPLGKARITRRGRDLTIVSSSFLANESLKAAEELKTAGIDVEVVDLRTIKPLDTETVIESVRKTGRLLAVDGSWIFGGVGAELCATAQERAFRSLKAPAVRLCLPDSHTPADPRIEKEYFLNAKAIARAARQLFKRR